MATHNDLTNSQAELAAELETAAVEHTENLPVGSAARFAGLNVMVVGHDSDYHYPLTRIMYIATGREETVASDAVTRGDEDTFSGLTTDQIITAITKAPTKLAAYRVLDTVSRKDLLVVADQLYIDAFGRSTATIRTAVIKEARA
jgi:hypothetical protein